MVGVVTADIFRQRNTAGESVLGRLIADAHLAATSDPDTGGAVVAFMNSGGVRENILFAASGDEADGEVTYAEAFAVHPFGNSMVTMTLTGAQIRALLEQQFQDPDVESANVLQVSRGFSYTWDAAQPQGARVDPSGMSIDGVPVDPGANYRVTVNSFLAGGGSGFSVLTEGTERDWRSDRPRCPDCPFRECGRGCPGYDRPHYPVELTPTAKDQFPRCSCSVRLRRA